MKAKLEDVCQRGSSNLKQSDIVDMKGNYPIYGATGYIGNINFYHQENQYVAVVKDGAGIGRTTLHPAKSSVIGTMQYLLPKENVLPEYLYYVVRYMHLERYFTGATIPHIYFKDYKNEEFNLESLEKQAEIIDVLGKCERIIEARKQEIQLLDELIKARFVEMFGDLKSNNRGWRIVGFKECADIDTNMIHDFEGYEDYPHIGIDSIEKETGRLVGYRTIAEDGVISGKYLFSPAHIIYSKIRPNLNKVAMPDFEGLCSADAYPILVKEGICNREYFGYTLRSKYFLDYILAFSNRTNLPKVNKNQVEGFTLPLPPIDIQEQFSDFVHQVNKSKFIHINIILEGGFKMEINFSFLEEKGEYELFASACIDAEKILESSPVMSAVASRKALELCVKWVYSIDSELKPIEYREGLQSLLHNNGFPSLMDYTLWNKLQHIVRNGNESVHTSKRLGKDGAILSLNILFDFVQWIDYCYGSDYVERVFDETKIPDAKNVEAIQEKYKQALIDVQKNADKLVDEKDKKIEYLLKLNEELRQQKEIEKSKNIKEREYKYEPNMSEETTRRRYIDADLKANGYVFDQKAKRNCVEVEYEVLGMPNETGTGYADYVIWGDTGKIIAVLEAKRASESPDKGRNQAKLYADCIQNMQGFRPIIFYTNGFETYLWDDENSAPRVVSGIFPQKDINAMIERRYIKKSVSSVQIDEEITNRLYQLRAVTKCCENYEKGIRKCLLVMATGTGKTRTAASVVDVMTRSQQMGRVLFLADRKELVKQAKNAFSSYIPNTTMCNLLVNKDERNANIIFSTYPTILNAIDTMKNSDGSRFFSPGHFDLIIIDEAHRSIFNKYKAIFEYFDACLLGLTATPKKTVHQSTYEFFDMKNNMPTDVYEYDEAVNKDHVLVPFYLIETATQISDDGITYQDLDEDEREAYEDEFTEDEVLPEHIPPERINKYIFNIDTVDRMISDLMNNGIKHKNGNHVGKTIIFAQNKHHAKFIVERFDKLYPQYKGAFCKLVICDEPYAEKNLEDFKKPDEYPFITVTVDMLETGVDVPEITNLLFAKKVYSRIKFDQMIGRGTRLCSNLFGEGEDKKEFYVFDYMRNFQFFDEHPKGKEVGVVTTPVAVRFSRMVQIIKLLQDATYSEREYQIIRDELVENVINDVQAMNPERVEVRLELRYVERYKVRKEYECLDDVNKEEIISHLAGLVVSGEKDEAAINFDVTMYGLMISAMAKGKNFGKLKRHVISNASTLLKDSATIPDVKAKIPELKELTTDNYWNAQDILKFEETRKSLRDIMKFIPPKKVRIHYTDFEDEVTFREEGRKVDMGSSDFEDYRARVNEYVEAHKNQPTIEKLLHNKPISTDDYKELERIFTEELGTAEDYKFNYQDTPFGLLIRKIAKMDRDSAYAAFSSFIAEERPNADQIHFIEQVVDYVVENGYINNVLDLMKAPFDRPYKFSTIFSREEQVKFVQVINSIKNNALSV